MLLRGPSVRRKHLAFFTAMFFTTSFYGLFWRPTLFPLEALFEAAPLRLHFRSPQIPPGGLEPGRYDLRDLQRDRRQRGQDAFVRHEHHQVLRKVGLRWLRLGLGRLGWWPALLLGGDFCLKVKESNNVWREKRGSRWLCPNEYKKGANLKGF